MLFNSYQFLIVFLPITWLVYYITNKFWSNSVALICLIVASLFFYSWWNPIYFFLITFSILVNFLIANLIHKYNYKIILIIGILFNLILIGYFKYFNFFIDIISFTSNIEFITKQIILPLGISFYTFQQITFLVDIYNKKINDLNFKNYTIFVTFFPQLIAGPIVHHSQVLHQFKNKFFLEDKIHYLTIGFSIFAIGLFKKVIIADNLSTYASPIFFAADQSMSLSFLEAWSGVLCYTFQLYFDFSGYSDMAVGLGYMFGIKLPINFNSPFKSTNVAEFWRSWHITLGIFIRNYVYYPISIFFTRVAIAKKRNAISNYLLTLIIPTLITYLLLGLWHGSGINFILFGALHGIYIIIYNLWKRCEGKFIKNIYKKYVFTTYLVSCLIVFFSFSISLVFFRAPNYDSALIILYAMINFNNIIIPESWFLLIQSILGLNLTTMIGITYDRLTFFYGLNQILIIILLYLFCLFGQNTMSIFHKYFPNIEKIDKNGFELFSIRWQPNIYWAIIICLMFTYTFMNLSSISEFIYFQF